MISNLLYSQNGYPRQIVYNGDTVVAISRHQVERLNIAHEVWQGSIQQIAVLASTVDSCHTGFLAADSAIHSLQDISYRDLTYIHQQSAVIDTLQQVIKDQKRVIRKLRIQKGLMGALEGVLTGVIAYLLIHG
jgi:hypothetical protein